MSRNIAAEILEGLADAARVLDGEATAARIVVIDGHGGAECRAENAVPKTEQKAPYFQQS